MARILIAEDDLDQLEMYARLFETVGHQVVLAPGGSGLMRGASNADLVVMDLRIPDAGRGMDLIRGLRASGYAGPLVLLSGWPDEIYGTPEEQMVSRVMVKPVPVPELLHVIDELTT